MRKYFAASFVAIIFIISLTSCSPSANKSNDIISQKISSPEKIPITILVKHAFSINTFEDAVEAQFPNVDIIQVGNYTSDMGIAEYETRLKHDDLTDIVMTWPLDVGEEYWENRLVDLSSLPLTEKYATSALDSISKNGKLFYLPGPSQVRGIVYNKTLFKENGWQVPKNFEEFIQLCHTIENSGIRSLQLGLKNQEVFDAAFIGFSYKDCFSKPQNSQWLTSYNAGKGHFADNFTPALNTFQILIDEGILKKADLDIDYTDRESMIFNRQCAMIEDSVLLARMGKDYNGCTDEFALMPFFNPGENGDWARLYAVCFIGINKHLTEQQNQKKYDIVMDILEYISTPQGQAALSGDTGAMYSSLKEVAPPNVPETKDLLDALSHGRCAVFPTLANSQTALRKALAGMLAGNLTAAEAAQIVDKSNVSAPVELEPIILGRAKENFSMIETGNFVTDAMRKSTNCDIALHWDNGKDGTYHDLGISAKFYKDDLTIVDVNRVLNNGITSELLKITMTGEDLIKTLEYSTIPPSANHAGWFYYFSGLKMEYAPAASPGKRIHKITDSAGKNIDPTKLYSIAIMDGSVPKEYIKSSEKTGIRMSDMLVDAIVDARVIVPNKDGRFVICQP